jgi:hypothetical protein
MKNTKAKKEKNYKNNKQSKIQKRDSKKKRECKFENLKDGLNGKSEEIISKHKETKANCWWYECDWHYILECYAKKTENGKAIIKVTVSAAKKRKYNNNDNLLQQHTKE